MCKGVSIVCVLVIFGLLPLGQSSHCEHGDYSHNGSTCCLCQRGSSVSKHCDRDKPTKCEDCPPETYSAVANSEEKCEQCTKCNSNANLEEERGCTPISDVVCKCMQGFFCESEHCKACHPCEKCEFGEEDPCTPICKTTSGAEDTAHVGIGAGIAVAVAIAALICGVLWWKKKFCFAQTQAPDPEVRIPLKGIDLKQFVWQIVEELSWKDMVKVAGRTGMSDVQMDRIKHDNPGSEEEQTRCLLNAWIEQQGLKPASETLCQTLRKCNLKRKADKIERIITAKADV